MLRKLLIFILSSMFIWVQTSFAYAQNYHFNAFDHMKNNLAKSKINSRGLTGQVGFRVPFGHQDVKSKKAFYGFKLTYGQELRNSNPFKYGYTRDLSLISSGFNQNGIQSLHLASYSMLDEQKRLNIFGNGNGNGVGNGNGNGMFWGLGIVLVGVGACWALGCFDGDNNNTSDTSDTSS